MLFSRIVGASGGMIVYDVTEQYTELTIVLVLYPLTVRSPVPQSLLLKVVSCPSAAASNAIQETFR